MIKYENFNCKFIKVFFNKKRTFKKNQRLFLRTNSSSFYFKKYNHKLNNSLKLVFYFLNETELIYFFLLLCENCNYFLFIYYKMNCNIKRKVNFEIKKLFFITHIEFYSFIIAYIFMRRLTCKEKFIIKYYLNLNELMIFNRDYNLSKNDFKIIYNLNNKNFKLLLKINSNLNSSNDTTEKISTKKSKLNTNDNSSEDSNDEQDSDNKDNKKKKESLYDILKDSIDVTYKDLDDLIEKFTEYYNDNDNRSCFSYDYKDLLDARFIKIFVNRIFDLKIIMLKEDVNEKEKKIFITIMFKIYKLLCFYEKMNWYEIFNKLQNEFLLLNLSYLAWVKIISQCFQVKDEFVGYGL